MRIEASIRPGLDPGRSAFGEQELLLQYDPLGRLRRVDPNPGPVRYFLYDGDALVMEYNSSGSIVRRYAHGGGVDNPLMWWEGASAGSGHRWLYADERGSIVAHAPSSGEATAYAYDAFGAPDAWTGPRFRYTGQIALNDDADAQLYHYKARVYDPALGRFLQTDPIGHEAASACICMRGTTRAIESDTPIAPAERN